MSDYPEREYGLGNSTPYVNGPPRVAGNGPEGVPCPNCGCPSLFMITADIKGHPVVGDGVISYVGCPACPWASRAIIAGRKQTGVK
jgi:hypothetical protein